MGLLHEIQQGVVQEEADLGPLLLKLRLLASRLGSEYLEEWVKHESEGYPQEVEVPDYRKASVSYRGTFFGPMGSAIKNAQIPSHLIEKFAGEQWVKVDIRESIAVVDDLARKSADGDGSVGINASDLILLLQGNVYEDYACNDVQGTISPTALSGIQQTVRARILELTLELEKSVPAASEVTFGAPNSSLKANEEQVQQISQQIIYGDVATAVAGGPGANVNVNVSQGDAQSAVDALKSAGIAEHDAEELASILASEQPESSAEPFGTRAKQWIGENVKKAAEGVWDVGVATATKIISDVAMKFYGLK